MTRRSLVRLSLLGPAFVAGIAYVDPGNVATNTAAGARYGYLLVWVIVFANAMAILVQYLSAKLGIASGATLAELSRREYGRRTSLALWAQAEAVALATDLAEVIGGALALNLLFHLPLFTGGLITAVVSFAILTIQGPTRQQWYERVILLLLGVIGLGFVWSAVAATPDPVGIAHGLVPRFAGAESLLLATGMLGATVMPHAIYLHSSLVRDRFGAVQAAEKRSLLRATRFDVTVAMAVAGAVNLAMVLLAAGALRGRGVETIQDVHQGLSTTLGSTTAFLFALALLASGLASSSVGTYAGAVIWNGFMGTRLALVARRLLTLVPAVVVLGLGIDPTAALIASQVVLSFGIPFALFPLVRFTADRRLMGDLVNRPLTTYAGRLVVGLVTALNLVLVCLTVAAWF